MKGDNLALRHIVDIFKKVVPGTLWRDYVVPNWASGRWPATYHRGDQGGDVHASLDCIMCFGQEASLDLKLVDFGKLCRGVSRPTGSGVSHPLTWATTPNRLRGWCPAR